MSRETVEEVDREGRRGGRSGGGALETLLMALSLAMAVAPASAELRRLEALGATPTQGAREGTGSLRQDALAAALEDAVLRVARGLVSDVAPGSPDEERLRADLGDPGVFASRFRILEDRGEQPGALLLPDSDSGTAYVVLVEAHVDVDRVRERLQARGWPLAQGPPRTASTLLRVEIEGIQQYRNYATLRDILARTSGVRSVVPRLFEVERIVLAVDGAASPGQLLEVLRARAPQGLELIPLQVDDRGLRLRVRERGPAAPAPDAPIDTPH